MDFRLDDNQLALRDAVAGFAATRHPIEGIVEREGALTAAAWDELTDLGVFSLLVPEAEGGLGLGAVEGAVVFEQLGRNLVSGPLVWSALAPTLSITPSDSNALVVGGIDLAADPHGPLLVEHATTIDALLVLSADGVAVVDRAELPDPVTLDPFDPLTPVGRFDSLPGGRRVGDAQVSQRVRNQGAVLTAAFLVGVADRALEVARDYSLEREQFGQPIGTFQALKHIMADMLVRASLARSATYAAAAVLDDPAVGDLDRSVRSAKLLAGEAAVENARASVQVLGGMGFTWEMVPNFLLKRAWVLEQSFGSASAHADALGRALVREVEGAA